MDTLKLKDLLLELIEELKIARITVAENEGRIQQLVKECHDKERKLEEEAIKTQSLKDKHEETETILSKASDDKINHLKAEKTKLQLAGDSWEKEMKALKDEVRTLQLSKYNLERTVREQQHRLQTQGQSKASHSEQVADIENRCKHLQKEMASYNDTLNVLKKEVTEAGVLNRMLASTNSHQTCQISSLREELERRQQDLIKLRVHITEWPDNANEEKQKIALKIEQLNKELKQVAQINQDLKVQLEETKLAHQVTQAQLQESQDLAQRCMTSSKELTERASQQEAQVASLTKECALLSEQRIEANTQVSGIRNEMDEWEAKKKAEIFVLEEEAEKVKNECSNLKKAVLNMEDINVSWASKNQAMAKDVQSLKVELDSQSAELDKLKVPISKFDKDTQTHSSTNDDYRLYASTSRTCGEEDASNLPGEKSVDGSVKGEEMQTVENKALDRQVEHGATRETPWMEGQLARNISALEGNSSLRQGVDTLHAPHSDTACASSQEADADNYKDGDTAQGEADIMDGQKTKEPSSDIYKDHSSIEKSPVKATVLEQIRECNGYGESKQTNKMDGQKTKEPSSENNNAPIKKMPVKAPGLDQIQERKGDDGDDKQGVTTGEEDSHHQLYTFPLPIPGHLSDGMCLDPDNDAQTKGCATAGQNADKYDCMTTQTTLNKISVDGFSGSLDIPSNINCTASDKASMGNQQLPPDFSNNRETTSSLDKEETLSPMQLVKTLPKMSFHNEPDARVSTTEEASSHGFGNQDKAEIYDEDIVIPSTYAEENSNRYRGDEYGKKQERETMRCDHDASMVSHETSIASPKATDVILPVTAGSREEETVLYVSASSQGGLKGNNTESAKTLPVLLLATENKSGDGKFDIKTTPTSTDTCLRSENRSTSKDLGDASKTNTLEKSANSETADTETVPVLQERDGSQDTRRLRSRSRCASTDEEKRHLPAKHLRGLDNYNIFMRKEKCTSLTTESSYLQTPKRKLTPSSHQVTSHNFVPKNATLGPDATTAFSYLSNSEPLSGSNIDALQKHSLAKTKLTWSSPILKKSTESGSAMAYSSWKTLEPRTQSQQQQQGKELTRNPVMFSHLPPSAQQLHQSLYPTTPSTASPKIPAVHPTSISLSNIAQKSTEPPRTVGLLQRQDSIPKTSITGAIQEIQGVMPRLTHGRSFIDRSSERELVPDSALAGPKHPPVPINLKCWLPPGMDQNDHDEGAGGDAGGEVSLFSDEEADEDMEDGVASQIDRIQSFLKKDRLKRAKLE